MKWIETTDECNPLSCRGEYSCDIPWLQHTINGAIPDWWKDCKEIARKMLESESAKNTEHKS